MSLGPKVPFTKEEDAILKRIVEQYQRPDGNWAKICDQFNLLPGTTKRNIRQVRERYKNYLDQNNNYEIFTKIYSSISTGRNIA